VTAGSVTVDFFILSTSLQASELIGLLSLLLTGHRPDLWSLRCRGAEKSAWWLADVMRLLNYYQWRLHSRLLGRDACDTSCLDYVGALNLKLPFPKIDTLQITLTVSPQAAPEYSL